MPHRKHGSARRLKLFGSLVLVLFVAIIPIFLVVRALSAPPRTTGFLRNGVAPADAAVADHTEPLLRWAEAEGLETLLRPAMLEYKQKGGGVVRARGTVASRAIKKGEVLVGCPRSLIVSWDEASRDLGPAAEAWKGWDAMVLLLMVERAKLELGVHTVRSEYIAYLVHEVPLTTVPFFSDQHEAEGSTVYLRNMARAKDLSHRISYDELAIVELRRSFPAQLPGPESAYSFERYAWASEMISTRYWHLPLDRPSEHTDFMVPVMDLPNYGNSLVRVMYNPDKDRVEMKAQQDFQEGEEVTFYYGRHCSEEFLTHYGFDTADSRPCTRDYKRSMWLHDRPLPNPVVGEEPPDPKAQRGRQPGRRHAAK